MRFPTDLDIRRDLLVDAIYNWLEEPQARYDEDGEYICTRKYTLYSDHDKRRVGIDDEIDLYALADMILKTL